jgi:hypothetical protein
MKHPFPTDPKVLHEMLTWHSTLISQMSIALEAVHGPGAPAVLALGKLWSATISAQQEIFKLQRTPPQTPDATIS